MVIHDNEDSIDSHIGDYEARLRASGLSDIPFHAVKLLHGHEGYEGVSAQDRKRMLVAFATFVRRLPITYHVFSYTDYDVKDQVQLAIRLGTDIEWFLDDRRAEYQSLDEVWDRRFNWQAPACGPQAEVAFAAHRRRDGPVQRPDVSGVRRPSSHRARAN